MLKTVLLLNIFVETVRHFQDYLEKELHLFEIEILCNIYIIKLLTVIFD